MPNLDYDAQAMEALLDQVAIEPVQTYLREILRSALRQEALLERIADAAEIRATEPEPARKTRAA